MGIRTSPIAAVLILLASTSAAYAESCWDHNGSLMRLVASGNSRSFIYESPKSSLRNAGVQKGTLLFNGVKSGNSYSGTARVFSKYCKGNPLEYSVSGPISNNSKKVTVSGWRPVHNRCQNTGKQKRDVLVFTYSHQC